MSYLTKDNIKQIFPTTKNDTKDKLLTENAIVDIINHVIEMDSYAIDIEDLSDAKFIIHGYYFNVDVSSLNTGANLYAWINLDTITDITEMSGQFESKGWDTDGNWTGLTIDTSLPTTVPDHYIQLVKNSEINEDAYFKYTTKSIQNIDGGIWQLEN